MALDTQTEQDVLCPTCEAGRMHPQRITEHFPYEVDGETVMVVAENVPVRVCDQCGEQLSGPEAARIRHEAICRALGLLTPAEIRAIRERLGTQAQFAKLTRIGEATICRWERGRLLQNPAMDRYLRLIAADENNIRILQGLPKIDGVVDLARWLYVAAHEAGQAELVRGIIAAAMKASVEMYGLPSDNEADDEEAVPTVIGSRFAAAWDKCDQEQRKDG